MASDDRHEATQQPQPTQTTSTGVEIPIPKREDFLRDLRKVAPTAPPAKSEDRDEP